ncbi:MAG: ABC transporter permease [Deltaproteobacteria bacterium]|jgi:phospholipid/cholesterol/gamma-HCH transport system permease protein|nr:ABC transporter permease [Deltaproteobacteria bacterium]MBW2505343.1 ABC transporter permease [Deltaproteobacteria bacterium]MBW2520310.1 ABC transporter permease [Deltaproteobacteria bacterium]
MTKKLVPINPFHSIGHKILSTAQGTGEMIALLLETVYYCKEAPRNLSSIYRQVNDIGIGTLPIAMLMSLFVGMVLSLQTGSELAMYGSQEAIGAIVGLSMVRELGPVMTSLLVAGRIGSAMAAEVGAMQVYEEIDALKTLEINPVRYLAMPRLIACLLSVPALVVFAVFIGVIGGGVVAEVNPKINVPFSVYYDNMIRALSYKEVLKGLLKALVFGGIIAQVGCYVGFKTKGGARGIGESTTRSVVLSFLLIMFANYLLTRFMI